MADEQPKHGPNATSKIPLHFCRYHSCQNGDGDCDYTNRDLPYEPKSSQGTAPPPDWTSKQAYNNHHVLPVSSLAKFETWDAYSKKESETICAVYAVTKWCSASKSNLIRLPKNTTIRSQNNVRLPAHDTHHNNIGGYNDQVTTQLHLQVWAKAKKAKGKELHPKDGKTSLLTALQKLEGKFRKHLKNRGNKQGRAGDSMVGKLLSRPDLLAALKLKKGQLSWRR